MSHIKDRLSDYHDFMKKLVDDHQMVLASDVLDMVEQLQADMEQDEKENGWIPVSERLPKKCEDVLTSVKFTGCLGRYGTFKKIGHIDYYGKWSGDCSGGEVIAWKPLPEPYKEDEL